MSDVRKDTGGALVAWQSFLPLPDTVRHEEDLQGALRGDIALFDAAEKKARAWLERRELAVDQGFKALGEMSACKDPVSAAAIYGRWLTGNLMSIAIDLIDAQDFVLQASMVGQRATCAVAEGFAIPAPPATASPR